MRCLAPLSAALVVVAALTAPQAPAALGPVYGGSVRLQVTALGADPAPTHRASVTDRWPMALVHDTLLGLDDGRAVPRLAHGVPGGVEGREWRLILRDGLVFHDGRPVTSADAVRSLRRFLRSGSPAAAALAADLDGAGPYRDASTDELPGIAADSPQTIVLRTRPCDEQVLLPLAALAAAVSSPTGAGAGPFVPTLWSSRGAVLTAFPGHAYGRPLLDEVHVATSSDAATDLRLAGRTGFTTHGSPAATLLLAFDPSRPPFDDLETRRQVAAAVDAAALVRHFLPGGAATSQLLPPASRSLLARDPDAVKVSRPSAGGGHRLAGSISLAVGSNVPPMVSQRVVAHLLALGLTVDTQVQSADAALVARASARLVLWSPELNDRRLALAELVTLAGAGGGEAHGPLDAARRPSGAARLASLAEAEHRLTSRYTLLPLAVVPVEAHARPGLHGVRIDPSGLLHLDDAWREP